MKVQIWGSRGSIPSPLKSEAVEHKLHQAIFGMPSIDTENSDAVWGYIKSLPTLVRGTAGGNTTCVEVQAGGETFIIDAGSGIRQLGLELMKGPCGRGEGTLHLLFSHFHWDHIQGFPFFVPAFVPGNRIFIYSIHDAELALNTQQNPLNFPVSLEHMNAAIEFRRIEVGKPFQVGCVKLNTLENAHPGKAYSYRFEDEHNIFVQSSDSEYKQLDEKTLQPYLEFFKDADALVFDAQYTLEDVWHHKVDWGHSSAMIGVDLAQAAGVKKLLLFHHDPTYSDDQLQNILAVAEAYRDQNGRQSRCEISIAHEGLTLDLTPPGAVNVSMSGDGKAAIFTPTRIFDERGLNHISRQLARLTTQDTASKSIIDLSNVERLTTSSLKSLVMLHSTPDHEPIVLAAPSEAVRRVIELGGFSDQFTIYPSVEAALTAVKAREALNLPGNLIKGRYQIETKLGGSFLGTTLKATDTKTGKPVIVKVMNPVLCQDSAPQFIRQMSELGKLNHHTIAGVVDWGHLDDDYFVVEEFIEGQTLADLLAVDVQLPLEQIFDIALNLNLALEHIHSHGIIHGNLKPDNIFLTADGIKIGGFGQGRLLEGRNLLNSPVLQLSATYLAPEQILGQPLDARVDLYVMGVTLFQLFTGKPPFEGSDREVLLDHLHQLPRSPRELNPELSLSLEHLALKLLAKNPNDRYANATQVRRVTHSAVNPMQIQPSKTLVGREQQLTRIEELWGNVCSGTGQFVFVSGESGIGKTRLVQQAAANCAPLVLLTGTCDQPKGSPAYHPFAELLQAYLSTVPPEFYDDEIRQLLPNFIRIVPQILHILPDLVEPQPLDPKLEQLRVMTSLAQFIKLATQKRPWFIVLENLQWADQNSLELLRYLCYHLPTMSLMIMATYRDTEVSSYHPLTKTVEQISSSSNYEQLHLNRLDQNELARLMTHLWGQPVPDRFTEKIYEHTGGNPFYVEEIVRSLVNDGVVTRQENSWQFPVVDNISLPASIREAVWRRIHRLPPNTQDFLRQAAVMGHSFRFDDVSSLSSLSKWEVMEHLNLALEDQLVQEDRGQDTFRFAHTEIQNVLYTDLNDLRRQILHRQAGETLERRLLEHTDQEVESLAQHFEAAGETERALHYSLRAAQLAQAAYANDTALSWYQRTASLLGQLNTVNDKAQQQLLVCESMGSLLSLMGRYDEALAQYDLARAQLEVSAAVTKPTNRTIGVYQKIAEVYKKKGEFDTAFDWLNRGLVAQGSNKTCVEAAHSYLDGAVLYLRQGKTQQALSWCEHGLELAAQIKTQPGQHAVGRAYYLLGNVYAQLGQLRQAAQFCRQSVQLYLQLEDPVKQSTALQNLGIVYYEQGAWDQAGEVYHQSLKIKRDIGDIYGQGQVSNNLGNLHMERGEWEQAAELFEQSLAIWQKIGALGEEANTLSNLAQLYIYQGHKLDQAQICLERSQRLFSQIGFDEFTSELQRRWSQLYAKKNNLDLALAYASRSVRHATQADDLLEEGISHRALGVIQWQMGRPELALVNLQHSLEILEALTSEYETAKTRMALAQLKFESGNLEDAGKILRKAIETLKQLKTQPALDEARELDIKISQPVLQTTPGKERIAIKSWIE